MAAPEVDERLLGELEAMGFPLAQATRALHFSGNSSIEAAINWIVEHENDPDIEEMPLAPVDINIEAPDSSYTSEQVKLKAEELRNQARKRRLEEEKKLEREREKERIRAGKEVLEAKRIAEENERKRFLALRIAEKEEEKRAREKIRQKLEQDKLQRRQMLGLPQEDHNSVKQATSLVQEKKDLLPIESTTLPVKYSTKIELMKNCLRSLKCQNKHDDAKVKRAFQTLVIYVRNVATNPDAEKFRKIRINNLAFQDRVGRFKEGIEFLELCGFQRAEGGEFLLLPRDKVDTAMLRSALVELHSAITSPFFGLISR